MSRVEKSLTEWSSAGIGAPDNVYSGFGKDPRNTYEVRIADESYDATELGGYMYLDTITGVVGTEVKTPTSLAGIGVSVITGMPLAGWSFCQRDDEVAMYELLPGDPVMLTYPGAITLFPKFEGYEFNPTSPVKVEFSTRMTGNTKKDIKIAVPSYIDSSLAPGIDLSRCIVFYTVSIDSRVVFTRERGWQGALASVTAGGTVTVSNDYGRLDGTVVPIDRLRYTRLAPANKDIGDINITMAYKTSMDHYYYDISGEAYISAWTLYPRTVYTTEQPDDQPPAGNQG